MKMLLAICAFSLACSPEIDTARGGAVSSDLVTTNGENLNGENLNGENLNGPFANGPGMLVDVEYALFAGASIRGRKLDSVWLEGSMFHGFADDSELSGFDFDNARFQAVLMDGTPVTLRIVDVNRESFSNNDVWDYLVQFRDSGGNWHPLCEDADDDPVYAIALGGRWNYGRGVPGGGAHIDDPGAFTFACKGLGAIAKCAFPIGYKPWDTVNGVSLAPYHQACVRALRADYCGDGTPWTQNGRRIDLYDALGIQDPSRPFWLFEAEWDQDGASCVSKERVIALRNVIGTVSPCILSKVSLSCGRSSDFQQGTLLMNRFQFFGISLF